MYWDAAHQYLHINKFNYEIIIILNIISHKIGDESRFVLTLLKCKSWNIKTNLWFWWSPIVCDLWVPYDCVGSQNEKLMDFFVTNVLVDQYFLFLNHNVLTPSCRYLWLPNEEVISLNLVYLHTHRFRDISDWKCCNRKNGSNSGVTQGL